MAHAKSANKAPKSITELVERLTSLAQDANKSASANIGGDDALDTYYQGQRNAYMKAADLAKAMKK